MNKPENLHSFYVRRCGAENIRCPDFREQMNSVVSTQKDEKQETVKPDELAMRMRYFGVDESDDEEYFLIAKSLALMKYVKQTRTEIL